MGSQARTTSGQRTSEDYDPSSDWLRGEERDTLSLYLPGFKKEDLKVKVDGYGNLRTNGERQPDDGGRPIRFWKDFRLPQNCKVEGIRAKFEKDTLVIMIPKLVTAATPAAPEPKPGSGKHDENHQAHDDHNPPSTEPTGTPRMEKKVDDNRGERKQKEEDAMSEKQQFSGDREQQAMSKSGVGGIVMGLRMPRKKLLQNMIVAVTLMVGLAIYMTCKFKAVKDTD